MKTQSKAVKVIKFFISFILILILSVSLFATAFMKTLSSALSEQGLFDTLEKAGYADQVREDVLKSFSHLSLTSGVPEDVSRAFLYEDVSDSEILLPLRQIFTEETLEFDTEALTQAFTKRVEAYAEELRASGEIELSDEDFEEMKKSFPETSGYYVRNFRAAVRLSGVYSAFGSLINFVEKLAPLAVKGLIAALAVSALMLLLIQRKGVFFWGYAGLVSAAVLILVPSFWYKGTSYVLRLGLEPDYLKNFIHQIALHLCDALTLYGTVFAASGAVLGLLGLVIQIVLKKKKTFSVENEEKKEEGKETTV